MIFTSMPPFFFAIFDYDLESAPNGGHDKAYHYPKLYLSGQNCDSFNLRRFSRFTVLAVSQGILITLLGAFFNDLVATNGQTLGSDSLGVDCYGLVVLVVLCKLAQLMNNWTWLMYHAKPLLRPLPNHRQTTAKPWPPILLFRHSRT
jgi:hypothetical protein